MSAKTFSVVLCWTTCAGDVWVTLNGHPGPLRIDARVDAGTAVRVVNGKAVQA